MSNPLSHRAFSRKGPSSSIWAALLFLGRGKGLGRDAHRRPQRDRGTRGPAGIDPRCLTACPSASQGKVKPPPHIL